MVLSRALSLAAVTLLVGCSAVKEAQAQENLEAGKSPSQIFAGTCSACHKSPRGLLKTVPPGSLQSFLRQHYTTSPQMAGVLSSYLVANGAADTRYREKQRGKDGKDSKEAKSDGKPAAASEPGTEPGRSGHKRLAHPAEAPEAAKPAAEGQVPQAAAEHRPEGRRSKRPGAHGKPGLEDEAPKAEAKPTEPAREQATGVESAKSESGKVEPEKPESAKPDKAEPAKPAEAAGPAETVKPADSPAQSATAEPAKENEALPPSLRRDPVPPMTPAPASAVPATPLAPATAAAGAASPSGSGSEAAPASPAPPEPAAPAAPGATASAPASAPAAPDASPAPPISR
jgi:hypothetical protein